MYDLRTALEVQNGRRYEIEDESGEDYLLLLKWIKQRDTTGTGYVNYNDFVRHYTTPTSDTQVFG